MRIKAINKQQMLARAKDYPGSNRTPGLSPATEIRL